MVGAPVPGFPRRLTRAEVSRILRVSERTLVRMARDGELRPVARVRRRVLYDAGEVAALVGVRAEAPARREARKVLRQLRGDA